MTNVTHHGAVHGAWPLVVRVAVATSLLAAALGAALYRFAGVSPTAIVAATAIVGLAIGWSLPPARPRLHRPPEELASLERS
jgi:small-conductance mechanosensitive channel